MKNKPYTFSTPPVSTKLAAVGTVFIIVILSFGNSLAQHMQSGSVHHRFSDAERWARVFEDSARDVWQRPEEVIATLDLQPTDRIADIGSATGYFPVRFARVATQGQVYGIDIEPNMVDYLNERAHEENLDNLVSILGTPDDPKIPEPVDIIFICDTYHHIQNRVTYFQQLKSYLRKPGKIVIVDFKKGDLPVGPPDKMKLAPEQVQDELTQAGYRLVKQTALPYQYLLIFQPLP